MNQRRIQEKAQERNFDIRWLLGHEKSASETILERRELVKALFGEILEARKQVGPQGSRSIAESSLSQKSIQSQNWRSNFLDPAAGRV